MLRQHIHRLDDKKSFCPTDDREKKAPTTSSSHPIIIIITMFAMQLEKRKNSRPSCQIYTLPLDFISFVFKRYQTFTFFFILSKGYRPGDGVT